MADKTLVWRKYGGNKQRNANIIYKSLGFRWLHQAFCPASGFVTADSDKARNPQRFIHATVVWHYKTAIGKYKTIPKKATTKKYLKKSFMFYCFI